MPLGCPNGKLNLGSLNNKSGFISNTRVIFGYGIGAIFTTLNYVHNLQMLQISSYILPLGSLFSQV